MLCSIMPAIKYIGFGYPPINFHISRPPKKASDGRGDLIAIAYDASKYHFIGLKHFISIVIG